MFALAGGRAPLYWWKKMIDSRKLPDNARHGSEDAFRELVARYFNMVHSTALRLLNV
jgi:DNA-directed RNA polymerase specialized sigma subunit